MSLFNLRIRGRLYGGFGALVLFGLAMAGFAVWKLTEIRDDVSAMNAQSANAMRSMEISAELQALRRAMLRYTFDQDEASFAESEKLLTQVGGVLEETIKASSEERRTIYREVEKTIADLKSRRGDLGNTVKEMLASRKALLAEGEKLQADLKKLVLATRSSPFAQGATTLQSETLLVQMANWRFFAGRDQDNVTLFANSVKNAQQQIAEMEKFDMAPSLSALFESIKKGLVSYSSGFDKASANLMKMDQLYYNTITPMVVSAIRKTDGIKAAIQQEVVSATTANEQRISGTITLQQIVAGAATITGLLIAFLIARGIIGPLSGLTAGMKQLAEGNFGVVLPGLGRKDEVGDMAQAVETFKVKAGEKAQAEAEARITQDQAAALQRKQDMIRLADDFEGTVGEIVEAVSSASTELEASASTLTSTADRSQQLTTVVATASEEASTNVQSVASATEEMASSITEIGRQVQESARIANEAVDQAQKTNDRVGELSKAAGRIGAVVELINTIAGQTNLLALNATIEAARAGDAGRGFAVVASEVKALAEQTAKATGEISQQIASIQTATDDSVSAIREIGTTIGKMSEIASTIASAVEEQGAATQEISRNVQQAAQGTMQVSSNIIDVQRGASETGGASSQVLSAAQSLSSDSSRLKTEVSRFLNSVRAA
ncbi:methyl-accepting chemotaxis protein [Tardiphaga sp. OK245]|jgi:methyl-accepting chemotaxis protein|uniref:methyl-accepting chemotaxis protein n=1 Tax=Tardiphaga sp. OK245 TaxID=1855306 RepID=UPI0008A7921F|nr:methyl-accepting chemotaxis protein [Tardiphaga sp. OK245]SEH57196.1 Methyl-accepting chemotaxis protein [Tardiphaga sp. OK245]